MPISPLQEPQYGEVKQLEDTKKAIPLRQGAGAAPQAAPNLPPPPAPSPNLGAEPDEEEFLSPFEAANLSYEEAVALFNLQVAANMAVDERGHPDMKELYWALKQDLDELRGENEQKTAQKEGEPQSEQKSATGASDEASDHKKEERNNWLPF